MVDALSYEGLLSSTRLKTHALSSVAQTTNGQKPTLLNVIMNLSIMSS